MENYNYLSTNNVDTTHTVIETKMCTGLLYSIPIISSIVCSVYIVLMFNQFLILSEKLNDVTYIIDSLNTTKTSSFISNLIVLEECILDKLQIC